MLATIFPHGGYVKHAKGSSLDTGGGFSSNPRISLPAKGSFKSGTNASSVATGAGFGSLLSLAPETGPVSAVAADELGEPTAPRLVRLTACET